MGRRLRRRVVDGGQHFQQNVLEVGAEPEESVGGNQIVLRIRAIRSGDDPAVFHLKLTKNIRLGNFSLGCASPLIDNIQRPLAYPSSGGDQIRHEGGRGVR